jgi:hypothetical protein
MSAVELATSTHIEKSKTWHAEDKSVVDFALPGTAIICMKKGNGSVGWACCL